MENYVFFWGDVFSNFHPATFRMRSIQFCSSEQAYMFMKAVVFDDESRALQIMQTNNPAKCKRIGRKITNFKQDTWRLMCFDIMLEVCHAKFSQNPHLRDALLATGTKTLVEASPFDTYWGIGMAADDPFILNEDMWRGENKLGIVLMEVRTMLSTTTN